MDPGIRDSMGISLKDAVVVLDEGHNMEDTAREAASLTMGLNGYVAALKDMDRVGAPWAWARRRSVGGPPHANAVAADG